MNKYLLGAILLLPLAAFGQEITQCPPNGVVPPNAALLCWENATQDVNGVDLPATGLGSLKQTRIQKAVVPEGQNCAWNATTNQAQLFNVTPDVRMMYFENLTAGKWCFRARHINNEDLMSDWSGVVTKSVAVIAGKPGTPSTTIY